MIARKSLDWGMFAGSLHRHDVAETPLGPQLFTFVRGRIKRRLGAIIRQDDCQTDPIGGGKLLEAPALKCPESAYPMGPAESS